MDYCYNLSDFLQNICFSGMENRPLEISYARLNSTSHIQKM